LYFSLGEQLFRNYAAEAIQRILKHGLDKRHNKCYRYLIGETPFLPVARMARIYGLGNFVEVPGYFEGNPGYIINIKTRRTSMGGGGAPKTPAPPKPPPPPAPPPTKESKDVSQERMDELERQKRKKGRASTLLAQTGAQGGVKKTLLGQ
jgi:hypothetical protein